MSVGCQLTTPQKLQRCGWVSKGGPAMVRVWRLGKNHWMRPDTFMRWLRV
jgi:hypothetical protein